MSVKFQETTQTRVTEAAGNAAGAAAGAASAATKALKGKDEDLSHRIGEYLTGGETGKGYLAVGQPKDCFTRRGRSVSKYTNNRRPISSNYKRIHYEPRCSRLAVWLVCKN